MVITTGGFTDAQAEAINAVLDLASPELRGTIEAAISHRRGAGQILCFVNGLPGCPGLGKWATQGSVSNGEHGHHGLNNQGVLRAPRPARSGLHRNAGRRPTRLN